MRPCLLLLLAAPLRAAAPLARAYEAPLALQAFSGTSAAAINPLSALTLAAPSLAGASSPLLAPAPALSPVPNALIAAPLVAAAVDPKVPAETASASGEQLAALLQGDPLKRVRLAEVVPGVLHMTFPSQRLMASTMLRFQEHYESPKYRNKVFTLEEFKVWYASQKAHGRFSYYKDWNGFNIPSRVLKRFKKGDFDPLDAKEAALLERVADREGRFYLIATAGKNGDPKTLRHEVAHGLWYTRPDYRRRAQALLRGVNLKPVFKMLERLGYDESVWLDEAHAWLGDDAKDVRSEGLNPKPYTAIRKRLRALQKEYVSDVF